MGRITAEVTRMHLRDACELAAIAAGALFAFGGIAIWATHLGWVAWVVDLLIALVVSALAVRSHLQGMATLHELGAEMTERERDIRGWPVRTARSRARASLKKPVDWGEVTRASTPPPEIVAQLGEQLQQFFGEYGSAYICETIHIAWSVVAPSALVSGALRIASCDEGDQEWAVMPGQDKILAAEPGPDGVRIEEIPSVWHLVCEHGLAGEALPTDGDD